MNAVENLVLQGVKLAIENLTYEIMRQREEAERKSEYSGLAAWINLDEAVALKGGAALNTYRTRSVLQPCCGLFYKKIGGRRCWRREDVIEWIAVDDSDLDAYQEKMRCRTKTGEII